MKVSIDGILGSARRINSQRQLNEEGQNKKKSEIRGDSLSISTRINSRLDSIDKEFRETQSSLTKNQIIRDGIEQLQNDYGRGGANMQAILDKVTFEGKNILRSYVGETITGDLLKGKMGQVSGLINSDIEKLKRLQVELDNITASNLAGTDKTQTIMSRMEKYFSGAESANIENISRVQADAVMRLIK